MKVETCGDGRRSERPLRSRNQSKLGSSYECLMDFQYTDWAP